MADTYEPTWMTEATCFTRSSGRPTAEASLTTSNRSSLRHINDQSSYHRLHSAPCIPQVTPTYTENHLFMTSKLGRRVYVDSQLCKDKGALALSGHRPSLHRAYQATPLVRTPSATRSHIASSAGGPFTQRCSHLARPKEGWTAAVTTPPLAHGSRGPLRGATHTKRRSRTPVEPVPNHLH